MSHLIGVATEHIPALPTGRRIRPGLRLSLISVVPLTLALLCVLAVQLVAARSADATSAAALPDVSAVAHDPAWLSRTAEITSTSPVSVYLPFVAREYMPPLSYTDDFSNSQSGWATGDTGNTRRSYVDGEYEILVRNPGSWAGALCPADRRLNYTVEADMRNTQGAGMYGLLFGWVDWQHFYLFEVFPDRQLYVVWKFEERWVQLIPWTSSYAVLPFGAANRLAVERKGAQITLRINSQFLQIITDGAYSGELGTGLYVQADASPAATVRFDNFRIEAP